MAGAGDLLGLLRVVQVADGLVVTAAVGHLSAHAVEGHTLVAVAEGNPLAPDVRFRLHLGLPEGRAGLQILLGHLAGDADDGPGALDVDALEGVDGCGAVLDVRVEDRHVLALGDGGAVLVQRDRRETGVQIGLGKQAQPEEQRPEHDEDSPDNTTHVRSFHGEVGAAYQ